MAGNVQRKQPRYTVETYNLDTNPFRNPDRVHHVGNTNSASKALQMARADSANRTGPWLYDYWDHEQNRPVASGEMSFRANEEALIWLARQGIDLESTRKE